MAPADPSQVFDLHQGEVAAFDDHVGAGTVVDTSGGRWSFHCTSIADGSRTIVPGTPVTFRASPGPTGFEAVDISPTSPA